VRTAAATSVVVALVLASLPAAAAAPADARGGVNGFVRLSPDPRMCPSPMCGGWFATPVNLTSRTYVAELDFSKLHLSARARARLDTDLHAGRALVRGRIVRGTVDGFPDLGVLVVSETWRAALATRGTGTVFRVQDRGLRCIAPPCFQWHAAVLSTQRHTDLSELDLGTIRSESVRERVGLAAINAALLAAGTVRTVPEAGPAGDGLTLVVSQVWFRTAGG
jgi:hypothetical protein